MEASTSNNKKDNGNGNMKWAFRLPGWMVDVVDDDTEWRKKTQKQWVYIYCVQEHVWEGGERVVDVWEKTTTKTET